jgi:hypothetical protein
MTGRVGWLLGHLGHDPQPIVMAVDQRAARPLAVLESRQPLDRKAPSPLRDGVGVHGDQGCDLPVGNPVSGQEHDAGSFDRPLRGGVGADSAFQLDPFGIGDQQRRDRRHAALLVLETSSHHMPTTNAELH